MSNNLDIEQIGENQALKEVSINTATGQLDAAITEYLTVDLSAGNVTIDDLDFVRNFVFVADGVSVARDLVVPDIKHMFAVVAPSGNAASVTVVRGTTEFDVASGETGLFYTDGTTNGLVLLGSGAASGSATPYEIAVSCSGLPSSSELLLIHSFTRSVTLPASLTGSSSEALVAATAQTDFDVLKNGASIGTIRFAASGTVATYVSFAGTNFVAGDQLTLVAPGTQDATLADIGFTISGVLS